MTSESSMRLNIQISYRDIPLNLYVFVAFAGPQLTITRVRMAGDYMDVTDSPSIVELRPRLLASATRLLSKRRAADLASAEV